LRLAANGGRGLRVRVRGQPVLQQTRPLPGPRGVRAGADQHPPVAARASAGIARNLSGRAADPHAPRPRRTTLSDLPRQPPWPLAPPHAQVGPCPDWPAEIRGYVDEAGRRHVGIDQPLFLFTMASQTAADVLVETLCAWGVDVI